MTLATEAAAGTMRAAAPAAVDTKGKAVIAAAAEVTARNGEGAAESAAARGQNGLA